MFLIVSEGLVNYFYTTAIACLRITFSDPISVRNTAVYVVAWDRVRVCICIMTCGEIPFRHRYKTPSSAFSQKIPATTPNVFTFSVEPLVIYNCALYN